MRRCEFEADALAAQVSGPAALARALVLLQHQHRQRERTGEPALRRLMRQHAEPPADLLELEVVAWRHGGAHAEAAQSDEADEGGTHPPLAQRLAALGVATQDWPLELLLRARFELQAGHRESARALLEACRAHKMAERDVATAWLVAHALGQDAEEHHRHEGPLHDRRHRPEAGAGAGAGAGRTCVNAVAIRRGAGFGLGRAGERFARSRADGALRRVNRARTGDIRIGIDPQQTCIGRR